MVKSDEQVIEEFNIQTNMSVGELQGWLENPKSKEAGTGVGIESGHKIVEILEKNPEKDPAGYDEGDIKHMRKVVGYNNRHMAQEDHLKETKTVEELENTKSTISMKNWGHDPVKTLKEDAAPEKKEPEGETASAASLDKETTNGNQEGESAKTIRSKRKLSETDAAVEEGEGEKAGELNGAEKSDDAEAAVEDGDAEADDHVRKKSKTTKEAEKDAVEE